MAKTGPETGLSRLAPVILVVEVGNRCCFKAKEDGMGIKDTIRQTTDMITIIIKGGDKIEITTKDDTRAPYSNPP